MPDYKTMYQILYIAVDKAVTELTEQKNLFLASDILKDALLHAEEVYTETAE